MYVTHQERLVLAKDILCAMIASGAAQAYPTADVHDALADHAVRQTNALLRRMEEGDDAVEKRLEDIP